MPVSDFLSSIADKAQSAINSSPLSAHIPGAQRSNSPDPATQPPANTAAAQGASKSHTFESIQHQFRSLQQQYTTTTPIQRIITIEKGVAIDFDSVSRDSKAQSKELYTWGQSEPEDLKDVTDRLAYLTFVNGSLAGSLSAKLDRSRSPLKALRDLESSIAPRRNIRTGLRLQINRIEHEQQKGAEKKLADLRDQLKKAEADDQPAEREIEIMKRKAVRESEQHKWDALREYGEKLVLLSQAATPIIAALPAIPPSPTMPYTGGKSTGAVRASLQRALDNYKTGHINLPPQVSESDLNRSDTLSFGESHASELSSINEEVSAVNVTPSSSVKPLPPSDSPRSPRIASPPIDVANLNFSPAPVPLSAVETEPGDSVQTSPAPAIIPTIAETGIPLTRDSKPGPSSGSLLDIRGPGSAPSATPVVEDQKYEPAKEEKKRLAAAYSQQASTEVVASGEGPSQVAATATTPQPQAESAEDEKKRLEREEREKILRGDQNTSSKGQADSEDLPPYEEPK